MVGLCMEQDSHRGTCVESIEKHGEIRGSIKPEHCISPIGSLFVILVLLRLTVSASKIFTILNSYSLIIQIFEVLNFFSIVGHAR